MKKMLPMIFWELVISLAGWMLPWPGAAGESRVSPVEVEFRQLERDIPLHYLRFAPAYKLKHLPQTPIQTLEKAARVARQEGLRYVYLSNLPGHSDARTLCPSCSTTLIERVGFKVLSNRIKGGHCPSCNSLIPGVDLG